MTQELAVLSLQPAELVRNATDVAGLCRDVVVATAKDIGGRKFIPVEGWLTIATAHGCSVAISSVEKVDGGIIAVAELRRAVDGFALSRAEGFVGDDEEMWAQRPEYARRAMSQTRAMSRVCRTAFAHVVVMMNAGLETTPAEEMHRDMLADDGHLTNDPVPSTYWDIKKKSGMEAANAWLSRSYDGAKMGVRKTESGWMVVSYGGGIETRSANAKLVQKSASPSPGNGAATGSWKDVICTFGKKSGPLRGKKLGELNDDSLKYLADLFLADGKEIKPGDRKMVAALAIWQESGQRKVSAPAAEEDLPKFNGQHHEQLFEQVRWEEWNPDDFVGAMKVAKVIPENAKSFAAMSDETAQTFLADWSNTKLLFEQFMEANK